MPSPLKVNLEIPAPSDPREGQALTDTIKALATLLSEAWPAISEVEEGKTPQETLLKLAVKLRPNDASSKITLLSRKFTRHVVNSLPQK
jgi:hypothetical protein